MTPNQYPELDAFRRELTQAFVSKLRSGDNPLAAHSRTIPRNHVSGEPYHGAAALALILAGYDDPRWITKDQADEACWELRVAESATSVEIRKHRQPTCLIHLYNVSQFEDAPALQRVEAYSPAQKHQKASVLLRNSGAHFSHARSEASLYCPLRDTIYLALRDDYSSVGDYFATALVHLNHWTGHPDRLDRMFGASADLDHAQESLLAHLASQRLADDLLLPQADASQEMLSDWIDVLESDSALLAGLAFEADTITAYLLSLDPEDRANSIESVSQSLDALALIERIAATEKAGDDLLADIAIYSKTHVYAHDPLSELIHRAATNQQAWSQTRDEARHALMGTREGRPIARDEDVARNHDRDQATSRPRSTKGETRAIDQQVIIRGNSGKDSELTNHNATFVPTVPASLTASPTRTQAVEQLAIANVTGPPGSSHFLNDIVLTVPDDTENQKTERKRERTPPQRNRQDHSLER